MPRYWLTEVRNECSDTYLSSDTKTSFRSIRLVRELTSKELEKYNIYTDTKSSYDILPEVKECVVAKGATIYVAGRTEVKAFDHAVVHAKYRANVYARNCVHIFAKDLCKIQAHNTVTVKAEDSCHIALFDNSKVYLYDGDEDLNGSCVIAYGSSQVVSHGATTFNGTISLFDKSNLEISTGGFIKVKEDTTRIIISGTTYKTLVVETNYSLNIDISKCLNKKRVHLVKPL